MALEFNILHKSPIVSDLVHAAQTVDNDPGNHKKKALLSAAITTGIGTYGLYNLHNEFPNITNKKSILRALTALAFPAGIYYAVTHNDSNRDIALGAGTSLGSLAVRHQFGLSPSMTEAGISKIPLKTQLKTSTPLFGALATGVYTFDQLQKAKKLEQQNYINNTLV